MVMIDKITHFFRAVVFDFRARRAIRRAQRSANLHRRKFLVLVWNGRPHVVSMQGVKKLIRQHRFSKGFTAETARRLAIFEAVPQPLNKCCASECKAKRALALLSAANIQLAKCRRCSFSFRKRNVSKR